MNNDYTILVVDDDPQSNRFLSSALDRMEYNVILAENGKAAVKAALEDVPDIVLMDIQMPEMDGYRACEILKNDVRTRDIPIIFLSGLNEEFNKVKGFELGAVDYLTKPINLPELAARISVHLELRTRLRELDEFNKVMVERELRIIEMKKEVNLLARECGRAAPYPEVWADQAGGEQE